MVRAINKEIDGMQDKIPLWGIYIQIQVRVSVDTMHLLEQWLSIFVGRGIFWKFNSI